MPSWFSKVFKNSPTASPPDASTARDAKTEPAPAPVKPAAMPEAASPESEDVWEKSRKVINAPILMDETEQFHEPSSDVRIKAQVKNPRACVFLVDRPLFPGHSAWCPSREAARGVSPLAEFLFEVDGVETVLIHNATITIERNPIMHGDWEDMARTIGQRIREHLACENPVIAQTYIDHVPEKDVIAKRLTTVLETEVNPSIAGHGGAIRLDRVEGNTVYIEMLGGCQGCAASTITLTQGVHEMFRAAVPQLGAILDVTDHGAGTNPFYSELPAGM